MYLAEQLPLMVAPSAADEITLQSTDLRKKWDGLGLYIVS
jgi:hypothetical protein